MLFNSYDFILLFLPAIFVGYLYIKRLNNSSFVIVWLVLASLLFYGLPNIKFLNILVISVIVNYIIGCLLQPVKSNYRPVTKKIILGLGITFNLSLLFYFKYWGFFIENVNSLTNSNIKYVELVLPPAISFYTFQQIAYIVDTYRNECEEHNFFKYVLFVTFFPQLIAGPIVHHKEIIPQLNQDLWKKSRKRDVEIGLTIFVIGLFKKVMLADRLAEFASPVFYQASLGVEIGMLEAWLAALAYTFQLYFDFSGYSDMAIGLARIFGIKLPMNFNSPYKSRSIIEFWRRWHITLSRFLRDYIYIPLGGNKKGYFRRHANMMITMLLGGIWHGAGWNFFIWGALHGLYLSINHIWRYILKSLLKEKKRDSRLALIFSQFVTFFLVVIAWVPFRADNFLATEKMLSSMFGFGVVDYNVFPILEIAGKNIEIGVLLVMIAWCIVWFFPNTQEILVKYKPVYDGGEGDTIARDGIFSRHFIWKFSTAYGIILAFMGLFSFVFLNDISEFIYFRF